MKSNIVLDHEGTPADFHVPSHTMHHGQKPLVVFVTPNYRNEPPSNAMLGEIGWMQSLASVRFSDGTQAIDIARWIPSGPNDLEGKLILIDPLAGTRNNTGLRDGTGQKELHIRTDIDRVASVIVRFPVSEAQFAQIQTVFCTYGHPKLIADFSNASLYVDMKYGPSERERISFGGSASRPYSVEVLRQFDSIRVPTQRLAEQIERDLRGAA